MQIDIRNEYAGIIPHKIWQVMFALYRSGGGPLDNMHCMLCDFNNLVKHWNRDPENFEFYWDFDDDGWTEFSRYPFYNARHFKRVGNEIHIYDAIPASSRKM